MSQSNQNIHPQTISDQFNTERVVSSKNREYIRARVLKGQITTNSYVDSLVIDCRLFETKLFHIKNKAAANGLKFKILACVDPVFGWAEIKAETTLAAASMTYEWDSEPWTYVKIQVKSAVDGSAATVDAWIAIKN